MQMEPGPNSASAFAPLMEIELRLVATEVIWMPELLGAAPSNADGAHAVIFRALPVSLRGRICRLHVSRLA